MLAERGIMKLNTVIFSEEELSRIRERTDNGQITLTVNLHGMSTKNARRFLKNLIALNAGTFNINVIHGFNHGCSIKEMLRNSFISSRIIGVDDVLYNEGMTVLKIT